PPASPGAAPGSPTWTGASSWSGPTPPAPAPASTGWSSTSSASAAGPAAPAAQGPAWSTPRTSTAPPAPPQPVPGWKAPQGPVVLGAGAVSVSLVVGLTALTVAGLMIAQRYSAFHGPLLLS